jgi:endonuclease/exonuclease/phosphatase family metal-dependent hydrolase
MIPQSESLTLYTHNTTDAFNEGDERIEDQFERLAEANPDAGFLSEAYTVERAGAEHLHTVLARFKELGYKAFAFDYSEFGRRDRHGGIMFVRRELFVAHQVLQFAGRQALQIAVQVPSGEALTMIGTHANDRQQRRALEARAMIGHYADDIGARWPVSLLGDLNSAVDESRFAQAVRAGGKRISQNAKLATMAARQESGQRSARGRLASIAIRASGQLDGDSLCRIVDGGFSVTANPDHLRTSYVPASIPAAARMALRILGLDRPYIEADYILANRGRFTDFIRYDRLPKDEHAAIAARYYFSAAA